MLRKLHEDSIPFFHLVREKAATVRESKEISVEKYILMFLFQWLQFKFISCFELFSLKPLEDFNRISFREENCGENFPR